MGKANAASAGRGRQRQESPTAKTPLVAQILDKTFQKQGGIPRLDKPGLIITIAIETLAVGVVLALSGQRRTKPKRHATGSGPRQTIT